MGTNQSKHEVLDPVYVKSSIIPENTELIMSHESSSALPTISEDILDKEFEKINDRSINFIRYKTDQMESSLVALRDGINLALKQVESKRLEWLENLETDVSGLFLDLALIALLNTNVFSAVASKVLGSAFSLAGVQVAKLQGKVVMNMTSARNLSKVKSGKDVWRNINSRLSLSRSQRTQLNNELLRNQSRREFAKGAMAKRKLGNQIKSNRQAIQEIESEIAKLSADKKKIIRQTLNRQKQLANRSAKYEHLESKLTKTMKERLQESEYLAGLAKSAVQNAVKFKKSKDATAQDTIEVQIVNLNQNYYRYWSKKIRNLVEYLNNLEIQNTSSINDRLQINNELLILEEELPPYELSESDYSTLKHEVKIAVEKIIWALLFSHKFVTAKEFEEKMRRNFSDVSRNPGRGGFVGGNIFDGLQLLFEEFIGDGIVKYPNKKMLGYWRKRFYPDDTKKTDLQIVNEMKNLKRKFEGKSNGQIRGDAIKVLDISPKSILSESE